MPIKESSKKSSNPTNDAPVLVLMRHGARAFDGDQLSNDGKIQAADLRVKLTELGLSNLGRLESSPKKRTQATLAPLAKELGLRVQVDARLDERLSGESENEFELRVKSYLKECDDWASEPQHETIRLGCSHLDWLEAAVFLLSSDENDFERFEPWPPLTIRAYTFENGVWKRRTSTVKR